MILLRNLGLIFSDATTKYLPELPCSLIALKPFKHFKLGGFIILKSSFNSYHVVFNQPVSWSKNVGIVAWVCLIWKNRKLTEWLIMQCIKYASTLRVSSKENKSSPRIVCRFGKQDRQIEKFGSYRTEIKRIIRKMQKDNQKL